MKRIKRDPVIRKQPKNKSRFTFSVFHKIFPFIVIIVSMQIASQKLARELNYDEVICGKPFVLVKGNPIYPFYSIIQAFLWSSIKGNLTVGNIVYDKTKYIAFGTFAAVISYFVLAYVRNLINEDDKNFLTNNRWGNKQDLMDCGLLADSGVVIGQLYSAKIEYSMVKGGVYLDVKKTAQLVQYDMNVCGMLMAGTRLGKGVSTVIPTHLNYSHSIISIDPKGENYDITAGWRIKFSYLYKFSPVSKDTLRFNILDEIDEEFAFRDANMIATILTSPSNPAANADPHWQETAKVLITATILHCKCSSYEDKSLPGVYKYLSQSNAGSDSNNDVKKELLKKMINSTHCREDIHQSIKNGASQILAAADEEMGSIYSSALESLSIFNDPVVAYATEASDFCLDDFKYSDIPISWYLTIPFPDLDRLKSLLRLIIEFVCRKFSQGLTKHGNEVLKNRILFIIDEFPTLGKMETIETFAGILNGYGISFLWIVQSKAQIDKLYGQNAPILEHCRFIWTYAMNDDNIAEYFSKRIGDEGVIKQNTSTSGSRFDFGTNNITINNDITQRRLYTANEIENMPPDTQLIFIQGNHTQMVKKEAYYSDPRFKDKVNLPKPETRKELLQQTLTSRVIREGDPKWWETNDSDDLSYYPETDVHDILSYSDVTEEENIEIDNNQEKDKEEIELDEENKKLYEMVMV